MKFGFDGNMFGPNLTYQFQWSTNRNTGVPELEAGARCGTSSPGEGFASRRTVQGPLDHESLVSSKYGLAERIEHWATTCSQRRGLRPGCQPDLHHANALAGRGGVHRRTRQRSQPELPGLPHRDADFGAAAQSSTSSSATGRNHRLANYGVKKDLLVVGGGLDYTESGHTGTLLHVADVQYGAPGGLGLYGAYLGRQTKDNTVGTTFTGDTDHWTVRGQASYVRQVGAVRPVRVPPLRSQRPVRGRRERGAHHPRRGELLAGTATTPASRRTLLPAQRGARLADDGSGILPASGKNELVLRGQIQLLL